MIRTLANAASILAWAGLWSLGGWWLVRRFFRLGRAEEALVGLGVGLILENLAANLFGQLMPVTTAFWLAAGLVFLAGLLFLLPSGWRAIIKLPILPSQWIALAALFLLITAIGRGLAIFDDYAHLPTTSLLAAGYLPPRFALDPSIPYDYHYFLLLFAAQLMRVTSVAAWKALDFARGLSFALAFLLTFVWAQRLTGSKLAGMLGGLLFAFGSGTRWLLLLLPPTILSKVAASVSLIGSGAQSGADLASALTGAWTMEGGGPIAIPFAFANGMQSPAVLAVLGPNGVIGRVLLIILLLTFNRWRGWGAAVLTALLWSADSLLSETGMLTALVGWGLVTAIYAIKYRSTRLPGSLWTWWGVLAGRTVLGMLWGGALQGIARGWLSELLTGQSAASYQTVGFKLVWPPEIVSAHLGVLSLTNPWQVLAAAAEVGPVILVLPLLAIWGWKAVRAARWYEAALVVSAVTSLVFLVVEFTGSTGVRNTVRLYNFLGPCALFAVPLVWRWAAHRREAVKLTAAGLGLVVTLSGLAIFATQLPAIQKPVYSYFITDLDTLANRDYWNRLPREVLVFDPVAYRAPTLFGRPTDAATTWYNYKPAWEQLSAAPDPARLRAAGFSFAYFDSHYWESLSSALQQGMQDPCVKVMREYTDWTHDFRRLLDLRGCPATTGGSQ